MPPSRMDPCIRETHPHRMNNVGRRAPNLRQPMAIFEQRPLREQCLSVRAWRLLWKRLVDVPLQRRCRGGVCTYTRDPHGR